MNRDYAKGMAKVKENDFLSAIEFFTLAIASDPNDVESFAERAVAYLNTNQYDLSMFDMHRCIEMEPNNSYRYSCRAFLKSKIGDTDGAIADYEMAVKLDPEDAIAYNNLGLAQETKGFRAKAEKSFDKSNKLIGYNPKRFDEGDKKIDTQAKTEKVIEPTVSEIKPDENLQTNETTKMSVAKDVFSSRKGFREFLRFIRNGFKIKE